MIKVAFLFDKLNDWIARYLPEKLLNTNGFCFNEIYDERNVRGFDIVFVIGYTKILKGEILKSNKLLLVVHESDLPNGKGFAPIQWQILKGVNEITVCLLELVDKIDSGNIYEKYNLSLDGTELYDEIRSKQANATFELIANFLSKYPNCYSSPQVGKYSVAAPALLSEQRAIALTLNDVDALLLQHGAEERDQLIVAFDDRGVSNGSRPVRSGVFNIVLEA